LEKLFSLISIWGCLADTTGESQGRPQGSQPISTPPPPLQRYGLFGANGGLIKDIVDAYVLAPGQNIEQEEDAHKILALVITRHMRAIVQSHTRKLALTGTN